MADTLVDECAVALVAAAAAFLLVRRRVHQHRRARKAVVQQRAFRGRYEYTRFIFDLDIFGDGRPAAVRHHFR